MFDPLYTPKIAEIYDENVLVSVGDTLHILKEN